MNSPWTCQFTAIFAPFRSMAVGCLRSSCPASTGTSRPGCPRRPTAARSEARGAAPGNRSGTHPPVSACAHEEWQGAYLTDLSFREGPAFDEIRSRKVIIPSRVSKPSTRRLRDMGGAGVADIEPAIVRREADAVGLVDFVSDELNPSAPRVNAVVFISWCSLSPRSRTNACPCEERSDSGRSPARLAPALRSHCAPVCGIR